MLRSFKGVLYHAVKAELTAIYLPVAVLLSRQCAVYSSHASPRAPHPPPGLLSSRTPSTCAAPSFP